MDIFLLSEAPQKATPVSLEGVAPIRSPSHSTAPRSAPSPTSPRRSASALALRWTPESGEAPLAIRELNVFADIALADHEVTGAPAALAQGPSDGEKGAGPRNPTESTSRLEPAESTKSAPPKAVLRPEFVRRQEHGSTARASSDGKAPIHDGPRKRPSGLDFKGTSVPPVSQAPVRTASTPAASASRRPRRDPAPRLHASGGTSGKPF